MVSGERLVLVKADTQIGEFEHSVIERLLYPRNQPFAESILSDW